MCNVLISCFKKFHVSADTHVSLLVVKLSIFLDAVDSIPKKANHRI